MSHTLCGLEKGINLKKNVRVVAATTNLAFSDFWTVQSQYFFPPSIFFFFNKTVGRWPSIPTSEKCLMLDFMSYF